MGALTRCTRDLSKLMPSGWKTAACPMRQAGYQPISKLSTASMYAVAAAAAIVAGDIRPLASAHSAASYGHERTRNEPFDVGRVIVGQSMCACSILA